MLNPLQIRAAELLSQGKSHQEVADAVGVSRRTILRWLNLAEFKNWQFALINRPRPPEKLPKPPPSKIKADGSLQPSDLIQDALRAVQSILCDPDTRVSDRLKAASLIGEWCCLKEGRGAEVNAVKVLLQANVLPPEVLDTFVDSGDEYIEKLKNSLRRQLEPDEIFPAQETVLRCDFDDEDDDEDDEDD